VKAFETRIDIRAPAERIWSLLTKVDGRIAVGETVKVHVKLAPGRAFPVKVAEMTPHERMVWRGGMPIPGLFKGERVYTLTKKGAEVEFHMREAFTGLLAPLIGKSIPDMQPAFDEFASALKKAAEAGKS
jgi:hypothetical protein